jgi:hypothetical protein
VHAASIGERCLQSYCTSTLLSNIPPQPSVSRLLALRAAAAPADTGVARGSSTAAAAPLPPATPLLPRPANWMSRSAPIGLRNEVPCDSRFMVEDLRTAAARVMTVDGFLYNCISKHAHGPRFQTKSHQAARSKSGVLLHLATRLRISGDTFTTTRLRSHR